MSQFSDYNYHILNPCAPAFDVDDKTNEDKQHHL